MWGVTPCTDAAAPHSLQAICMVCPLANSAGCLVNTQELRLHISGKHNINDAHNHFKAFHTLLQIIGQHSRSMLLRTNSLTPEIWFNTRGAVHTSSNNFLKRGLLIHYQYSGRTDSLCPKGANQQGQKVTTERGQHNL